jgi:hypothetical protein
MPDMAIFNPAAIIVKRLFIIRNRQFAIMRHHRRLIIITRNRQ